MLKTSLKAFLVEEREPCILHNQRQGCWWHDHTRSQDISSHVIYSVCPFTRIHIRLWLRPLPLWKAKETGRCIATPHGPPWKRLYARLILGVRPANERRCYFVTTSLIGWVQTYNQPYLRRSVVTPKDSAQGTVQKLSMKCYKTPWRPKDAYMCQ